MFVIIIIGGRITVINATILDGKLVNGSHEVAESAKFLVYFRVNTEHLACGCLISCKDVITTAQTIIEFEEILKRSGTWEIDAVIHGRVYKIECQFRDPKFDPIQPGRFLTRNLGLVEVGILISFY